MKISPIIGTGISGHQADFTLQDLIVLSGLQVHLKRGVDEFESKNRERKEQGYSPLDTVAVPGQVLTQCLTILNKIVGDVQSLDQAYAELFDLEAPNEKENEVRHAE